MIVPRRWGNVVGRNRAKRVLREILRASLSELIGGVDILVLPKGQLPVNDYQEVKAGLIKCLGRLGLLLKYGGASTSNRDETRY